jgi:hypothetical protein
MTFNVIETTKRNGFCGSHDGGYREFYHMDYRSSFLPVLLLYPGEGSGVFFRNIGQLSPEYTAIHSEAWNCSDNRVKVKLSQCLTSETLHHKEIWGTGGTAPPLDGGELSQSRPGRFNSTEKEPSIHWIRGCIGSRARLDAVEKRTMLPLPGIEPRPSNL